MRATPELPCVRGTGSRPQVELATSVDRVAPPRLAPIARTRDARLRASATAAASATALLRTLQCGVVRLTAGACVHQSVVVDTPRTCAQEVRGVSVRVASEPQQNVARIHLRVREHSRKCRRARPQPSTLHLSVDVGALTLTLALALTSPLCGRWSGTAVRSRSPTGRDVAAPMGGVRARLPLGLATATWPLVNQLTASTTCVCCAVACVARAHGDRRIWATIEDNKPGRSS